MSLTALALVRKRLIKIYPVPDGVTVVLFNCARELMYASGVSHVNVRSQISCSFF